MRYLVSEAVPIELGHELVARVAPVRWAVLDQASPARWRPRTREGRDLVIHLAPAPHAVLRGRHRYRLLLKAERQVNVQRVTRDWLTRVKLPAAVRLQIDIDPYSFL